MFSYLFAEGASGAKTFSGQEFYPFRFLGNIERQAGEEMTVYGCCNIRHDTFADVQIKAPPRRVPLRHGHHGLIRSLLMLSYLL